MSKEDSDILMAQLKQHCRENQLFQSFLADEMRRSQSQVQGWLSGGSSPTLTNATSLARAAGMKFVLVPDDEAAPVQ